MKSYNFLVINNTFCNVVHLFIWCFTLIGALTTTQIAKPKLVIAPVISQLSQTSTSTTSGSQSQSSKHMANLLLPVTIPQQSGTAKPSMFNLKINTATASFNSENKGTITGTKISC